jgi:hypothetical protein
LSEVTLVDFKDNLQIQRVRLTYALHGEGHVANPPTEVLDLAREDGEWKITAVDFAFPTQQQQQPGKAPEGIPLPGAKGAHPPAGQ